MVDQYFFRNPHVLGSFDPRGVTPELIFALREALDKEGFHHVKIIASGGFTAERIAEFAAANHRRDAALADAVDA